MSRNRRDACGFFWAIVVLGVLLLGSASAVAQTTIPGGNLGNQTWTQANGPYVIQGDATIQSGATLTVEPGVEVRFDATDNLGSGDDTSRVELIIDGTIAVQGTNSQPVTFTSNGVSTPGAWYGIVFGPTASGSVDHAIVEYAETGVWSSSTGNTLTLNHLEARQNDSAGIYVVDGNVTVSHAHSHHNQYGVRFGPSASGLLEYARVNANTSHGVYGSCQTNTSATTTVDHSSIWDNGSHGVYLSCSVYTNRGIVVTNSIVAENGGYGVGRISSYYGNLDAEFVNSWENGTEDFRHVGLQQACFSANPLFVSNTDATLTANSPARFASNTGDDIGALPYSGDPTPGLYGTLWSDTTLSAANSPHRVEGDLTAGPGYTLTIEAGATLEFTATDIMASGEDSALPELRVDGTLVVNGAASNRAVFEGVSRTTGSWYGFVVEDGGIVDINHALIRDADIGITTRSAAGVEINTTEITNCSNAGVEVDLGEATLDGVNSHANQYGVSIGATARADIVNALIHDNTSHGIVARCATSQNNTTTIHSSTVHNNASSGIYLSCSVYTNTGIDVRNTIATQNGLYGIGRISSYYGHLSAAYSNAWNNASQDLRHVTEGAGNFSANPLFANAPTDLSLTATSPCVDTGGSTGAPLHDIARHVRPADGDGLNSAEFDVGAYEYGASSQCGDGSTDVGEVCDDGAQNGAYGYCKSDCSGQGPSCGDGTTNGNESCDDGSDNGTYGFCNATCDGPAAYCGDGTTNGSESCDDGSDNGAYGFCNATCDGPAAYCGDGTTNGSESCDDGSDNGAYGFCNATCDGPAAYCGDGTTNGNESCDDGSDNGSYDYCAADCSGPGPRCGDGTTNGGEACDDGNLSNTDTCLNSCQLATCGDGFVESGVEACDDANASNADACVDGCVSAVCGDGHTHSGVEACDDGNADNDDGCTDQCAVVSCGDGQVQPGEECDDGNSSNLDSCLNTCVRSSCGDGHQQAGEACDDGNDLDNDACLSSCRHASCGDAIVHDGTEACDDGNGSNTDACLITCEAATCGDGYLEAGVEECDDGNLDDDDGCSSACLVETSDDVGVGDDTGVGEDAGAGDDAGISADAGDDSGIGDDAGIGSDIGTDIGTDTGSITGDQNATAANEGCGCSSASDHPAPGNAVYVVLVMLGLGGLRLRRRPRQ